LVKQLANATGSPDAQEVADAIAGKAADIERLQAEAAPQSPEMTRDAVDINGVLGRTASTASSITPPSLSPATTAIATVASVEWRGAQFLLYAAVLFLAFSAGGLVWLTLSVRQLSGELHAEREIEHPTVNGYAEQMRLALAKLDEPDEAERARGVGWLGA